MALTKVSRGLLSTSIVDNGNATAITIDSSENVGIGTTSPSKPLEITDATNDGTGGVKISSYLPTLEMDDISGGGTSFILQQDGANTLFKHDTTERMRIDSSGQLLLGRGANVAAGAEATRIQFYNANSTYDIASIRSLVGAGQVNRGELSFAVNNGAGQQERMRIDYSGNVVVGKTSLNTAVAGTEIRPNLTAITSVNETPLYLRRNSSDGVLISFRKDGSTVGTISTNASSLPSDRNFKKNIQDLTLGLNFVESLNPVTYNYKIDDEGQAVMTGLIAQEVEEVLTAAGVEKNSMTLLQHKPTEDVNESDYQMDYLKFIPILINSIKEQQTLIESLTARIAALEE